MLEASKGFGLLSPCLGKGQLYCTRFAFVTVLQKLPSRVLVCRVCIRSG